MKPNEPEIPAPSAPTAVTFQVPSISDGRRLWEIARDSRELDLNSSYAYVLWCRDFQNTSIVALVDGRVCGFVTGYIRPERPDTLVVWQVAVDAEQRGKRIAGQLLDGLLDRLAPDVSRMETTISPGNAASIALFTGTAGRRGLEIKSEPLFGPADFPDSHEPEDLYILAAPPR
ncbi:diaminobutyrate acetyltransferase [Tomitella biformata]|uniref:diaminobutyrate acetyltransferase n=1 Tax=Tomitella biformata TaxID=630403 RepID=UPI0004674BEB|nr:diaminobutyrate acetyltransferase [Tomitella biformata]